MTPDELKKAVWLLGQLFPKQLTESLARFARDEFKPFEYPVAVKVIRAHRAAFEFINWPALIEALKVSDQAKAAAKAADQPANMAAREGSWADVYRRQVPQLQGRSDVEVVLRVHRGWWAKAGGFGSRKDRPPSDGTRRGLEHSCTSQLIGAGIKPDDATKWAATIFEESVEYFRQVLEELRGAQVPQEQECPV